MKSLDETNEVELTLQELFNYCTDIYGIHFIEDNIVESPIYFEMPDQLDNWNQCTGLLMKSAPLYEIIFENGMILRGADDHFLYTSITPFATASKKLKDLEPGDEVLYYDTKFPGKQQMDPGDEIIYMNTKVSGKKLLATRSAVYSPQIHSDYHMYKDSNGLVHHNTYECTAALNANIQYHPRKAELIIETGDIGTAKSNLFGFFYKNRSNKIILLDDNDAMIMKSMDQTIRNIMKAILDPSALTKPVTIPISLLKRINDSQETLGQRAEPNKNKKRKESLERDIMNGRSKLIECDAERLKEGRYVVKVNGVEIVNEMMPLSEAMKLYYTFEPLREEQTYKRNPLTNHLYKNLREAADDDELFGDDFMEGFEPPSSRDKDDGDISEGDRAFYEAAAADENGEVPRQFVFDSSVIFISNLTLDKIDTAVLDRVTSQQITLTLEEFLDRISKPEIFKGLCKTPAYADIPKEELEWAKKCCLGCLKLVIEAWKSRTQLFSQTPVIRRKLTFRAFAEFVMTWLRQAWRYVEVNGGGKLSDRAYRDKAAEQIAPRIIRSKIMVWLATANADTK